MIDKRNAPPKGQGKNVTNGRWRLTALSQVRPRFVVSGGDPTHPRRSSQATCRRCCSRTCFEGADRRRRIPSRPPSPCSASCLAADAGAAPDVRSPPSQFRQIRMSVDPQSRSSDAQTKPPRSCARDNPESIETGSQALGTPVIPLDENLELI